MSKILEYVSAQLAQVLCDDPVDGQKRKGFLVYPLPNDLFRFRRLARIRTRALLFLSRPILYGHFLAND